MGARCDMTVSAGRCSVGMRSVCQWVALVGMGLVAIGCQSSRPVPGLPRMFSDTGFDPAAADAYLVDPRSKYASYEAELVESSPDLPQMDHEDFAMWAANAAMLKAALGDYQGACAAALDAQRVMTGDVKGESSKAAAAQMGDESEKVFKGECYEIAALNTFIGLWNLCLGDSETAAIGFRRAIEADKMSKDGCRDDFNVAFWGLGMAELDRDTEASEPLFRKCGYKSAETIADENMVFVLSMGRAPGKRLVGLYGEHDTFEGSVYEPRAAEVFVDGRSLGRGIKVLDLLAQCEGVAKSGKDVGQGFKAAGKFTLALTAGVFLGRAGSDLVAAAWAINADTRTCYMLPNEVHVLSGCVLPGRHTVRVKFFNANDDELPRYEQVWHYVPAPERGRQYVMIRSEFDRCNVQGPVTFTRISRTQTGRDDRPTRVWFRAANLPNVAVGDTLQMCHADRQTENRWDTTYHWRYAPMAYNRKGEPIGHPEVRLRMQDFDIGLVGQARVVAVDGVQGEAEVISLTTEYFPRANDMVTAARPNGRLWQE